jgi:hypothetical protein
MSCGSLRISQTERGDKKSKAHGRSREEKVVLLLLFLLLKISRLYPRNFQRA